MHDFVNDLAPPKISELFSYSSEEHHQCTRSSAADNLYQIWKQNKSARIWNSIPICPLSLPKYKFKWYTKTAAEHFDAKVYLSWRPYFGWQI